jgi:hypothetical protein
VKPAKSWRPPRRWDLKTWKAYEWLALDDASLARVKVGTGSFELAARELHAHLVAGRLKTAVRILARDGRERLAVLEPSFWRSKAKLEGWDEIEWRDVRGRPSGRQRAGMRVSPAKGIVLDGRWFFFFRRADLGKLYPSKPKRRPSKPKRRKISRAQTLLDQVANALALLPPPSAEPSTEPPLMLDEPPEYKLIREIAAEKFPGGYEHVRTVTIIKAVSDELTKRVLPVPKRDVFLRALGRRKG